MYGEKNREQTKFIGHRRGQFVAYVSEQNIDKKNRKHLMVKPNRSHVKHRNPIKLQ